MNCKDYWQFFRTIRIDYFIYLFHIHYFIITSFKLSAVWYGETCIIYRKLCVFILLRLWICSVFSHTVNQRFTPYDDLQVSDFVPFLTFVINTYYECRRYNVLELYNIKCAHKSEASFLVSDAHKKEHERAI